MLRARFVSHQIDADVVRFRREEELEIRIGLRLLRFVADRGFVRAVPAHLHIVTG